MDAERRPSRAARAEAALWLARLRADTAGRRDEAQFQAWLAEDPEHRAAFDEVTATWDAAGGLEAMGLMRRPTRRPMPRRRFFEAVAACAVVGTGVVWWQRASAGIYETGIGEQRRLALADGSELLLDTETRVRVKIDETARTVELQRGRVNCRVAEDVVRPFVVDAGTERIVASGTEVDIRREAEQVSVICLQGDAEVVTPAAPAPQRLSVGQRLEAPRNRPATVDQPDLKRLVAWQNGQAIFDATTLDEAVREMNRYGGARLELDDPHLAELRISGVYHVGDTGAFARSVASLLPVRVERAGDRLRIVADPGKPDLGKKLPAKG